MPALRKSLVCLGIALSIAFPLASQTAPVEVDVQGRFTVGENGDARYVIPVEVPPGNGRAVPDLSLVYSSQGSDDRLGVGWRLQGGSAIARCAAIPAIDGFRGTVSYGPEDRYCLDGQRLINVEGAYGTPGSVYRTELETWRRVTASRDLCGSGPCSFTVDDRGGAKSTYGSTPNSRALAVGRPDVRVWSLDRFTDTNGNEIALKYTQAPVPGTSAADGQIYLEEAAWSSNARTGTPARRFVRPQYAPREPFLSAFSGGSRIVTRALVKSVRTYLDGDVVKDYRLCYGANSSTGRPLVSKVQECAGTGASDPCLPSYDFHWQGPQQVTFAGSDLGASLPQPIAEVLPLDIDGNGKGDLAASVPSGSTLQVVPLISTGTAYQRCPNVLEIPAGELGELSAAELDRDGRGDLVYTFASGTELAYRAYRSNPAACGFLAGPSGTLGVPAKDTLRWPMDANGDGITDLVVAVLDPSTATVVTFLGSDAGFQRVGQGAEISRRSNERFWPAEVDGDGRVDLIQAWYPSGGSIHLTTFLSTGEGFQPGVDTELASGSTSLEGLWPLDVNGDGKADLVQGWQSPGGTLQLSTFLADGAGRFVCEHPVSGGFAPGCTTDTGRGLANLRAFWPMDADGDRRIDLVQAWKDGASLSLVVYRNANLGLDRGTPANATLASPDAALVWPLDLDGDGKTDLVQGVQGSGSLGLTGYLSQGAIPDLIDRVVDPVGGKVEIAYRPISDPSVYSQGDGAPFQRCDATVTPPGAVALSYPYRQAPAQEPFQTVGGGAMQVVQRTVRSNEPSRNASTYGYADRYAYEGARVDLASGRGWAGFARLSKLDESTGRRMVTTLNQEFPRTGTTAEIRYECDGTVKTPYSDPLCPAGKTDTLLTASLTCYEAAVTATGVTAPNPKVWEVLREETLLDTYSYGTYDFSRVKRFAYDEHGNVTLASDLGYADRQGKNLSTADDVYTCSKYAPPPAGVWAFGYLTDQKVSADANCQDFKTFRNGTDFSLEHLTYTPEWNVQTHAVYDDVNRVDLVTSYTWDSYGNLATETAPGPGDRTTKYFYDTAYHTFLDRQESPRDEDGRRLVQRSGSDPRFGVQVALSTPNGNVGVQCLDAFGRVTAVQGPIPTEPAGVVGDANCVPAGVTGDAAGFRGAKVVTLSTVSRVAGSDRRIYTETVDLQDWTLPGKSPARRWSRSYVDGLGRAFLSMSQEEPSQGVSATCTNFNPDDKGVRTSVPAYVPNPAVDCTSSGGTAAFWITQTYDAYGRPTRRVTPSGPDGKQSAVTTMAYDQGTRVTVTQAAEDSYRLVKVLEYEYFDSDRELRRMILPAEGNATTVFDYDRIGRLTAVTDPATPSNPNGVTNGIAYDSLDRRTLVDNPDQNACGEPGQSACQPGQAALTLQYDPQTGLLNTTRDATGRVTSFFYDAQGRMTRKVLPAGTGSGEIRYGYDGATPNGLGERTSLEARDASGNLLYRYAYGYDAYGNQASTRLELDGAGYDSALVYDPLRRVTRRRYPDGFSVDQAWSMGNPASVSSGAVVYASFADYAPVGGPRRMAYGNGTRADFTYAPTGQPVSQALFDRAGAKLLDASLGWNHLDQVTGLTDRLKPGGVDHSQAFGYTGTRLTSARAPGLYGDLAFGYDASGNVTSKDGTTYAYKAHRVISGSAPGRPAFSARYDLDGNLVEKKLGDDAWTFDYDVRDRLVRAGHAGESLLSVPLYNDAGSRLKKVTPDGVETLYVSSVFEVTRFPDGSREATRYVTSPGGTVAAITVPIAGSVPAEPGAGIPRPGTLYFHRDHLGSTSLTTGEDGLLATRMAYVPYGGVFRPAVSGPDDFRPKFQGEELDEAASLYYFGARYYDPALGRFLTPDTQLGSHLTDVDTLNRFAFGLNSPVTYTDPTGHSVWDAIGGALIGAAEIVLGVAIDVLSDGALEPLGGALIGAGMNGVQYSVTHTGNYSWKQYGIQEGEGAVFGLLTGGFGGEAEAGVSAVTAEAAEETAAATASTEAGELAAESEGRALTSAADEGVGGTAGEASAGGDDLGGGDVCAASFPAGVTVWTDGGELPIEELAGGLVLSRSSIDGQTAEKPVTLTLQRLVSEVVELELRSGDGRVESLLTTPNHPLWVVGKGWVPAGELASGDRISTVDSLDALVVSARASTREEPLRVYNFEVADFHSYFVGGMGVWAHNPRCRVWDTTRALQGNERDILDDMRRIARAHQDAGSDGIVTVVYDPAEGGFYTGRSGPSDPEGARLARSPLGREIEEDVEPRGLSHPRNCGEGRACNRLLRDDKSLGSSYVASFWRRDTSLANPCPNCRQWVFYWTGGVFIP